MYYVKHPQGVRILVCESSTGVEVRDKHQRYFQPLNPRRMSLPLMAVAELLNMGEINMGFGISMQG